MKKGKYGNNADKHIAAATCTYYDKGINELYNANAFNQI